MTTTIRSVVTLSDETRQRLDAYFDALLPRGAVDDAVAAVRERTRRDDLHAVFVAAHDVLAERARVSTEVEIDVLVHDAQLDLQEVARVLDLAVDDVQHALDVVAGVADELGFTRPAPSPGRAPDSPSDGRTPEEIDEQQVAAEAAERAIAVEITQPVAETVEAEPRETVTGSDQPLIHISDEDEEEEVLDASAIAVLPEAASRRAPIIAIVVVFAVIAALVIVASAIA